MPEEIWRESIDTVPELRRALKDEERAWSYHLVSESVLRVLLERYDRTLKSHMLDAD